MNKYGYLKPDGEFLIEPRFASAHHFVGEYGRANDFYKNVSSPELAGCSVSRHGEVMNLPNLSLLANFHEGMCQYTTTSKSTGAKLVGFVSAQGRSVISPRYHSAISFNHGRSLASVLIAGRSGPHVSDYQLILIDKNGVRLKDVGAVGTSPFEWSDGMSLVRVGGEYPVIGMSRGTIYSLLGRGDRLTEEQLRNSFPSPTEEIQGSHIESYAVSTFWCGNGCSSFQLLYEKDRVAGYRIASLSYADPFIRTSPPAYKKNDK